MNETLPVPGSSNGSRPVLVLQDVSVSYGGAPAVQDVTLTVPCGEALCVLGANGAGKSSLLNGIGGLVRFSGRLEVFGAVLGPQEPVRGRRLDLAFVPEERELFGHMTVTDNLILGAYTTKGRQRSRVIAERLEAVFERFGRLAERRDQTAEVLSGGEQQMLALGRALMGAPRLLVVDEPSLGLAPLVVDSLYEELHRLKDDGMTIVLSEESPLRGLELAERVLVLEAGRVAYAGRSAGLDGSDVLDRAYLSVSR